MRFCFFICSMNWGLLVLRSRVRLQISKGIRQTRSNIPNDSRTHFREEVSDKKMQRNIRSSSSYSITSHYYKSKSKSYIPYNSSLSTPCNAWSFLHEELLIKTKQLLWDEEQGPTQQKLKVSELNKNGN